MIVKACWISFFGVGGTYKQNCKCIQRGGNGNLGPSFDGGENEMPEEVDWEGGENGGEI